MSKGAITFYPTAEECASILKALDGAGQTSNEWPKHWRKAAPVEDVTDKELKPGDLVMVPCRVVANHHGDYVGVDLVTLGANHDTKVHKLIEAVRPEQVYRCNPSDELVRPSTVEIGGINYLGDNHARREWK